MAEYTYTVAMCNYNMAETLEESVRSIIEQVNDTYEVLIVDGGSSDGSLDILSQLANEYSNFRYNALEDDKNRHLGADRQHSIEQANGKYVLFDLDCDDIYTEGIQDFVEIFHQIEDQLGDLILKGEAINIAKRDLMMELPFRNVGMAEDKDLYRRALAADKIVFIKHYPFWKNIGYDTMETKRSMLQRFFRVQITCFRTGITFSSYLTWLLWRNQQYTRYTLKRITSELLMLPIAYLIGRSKKSYELPDKYQKMGRQYERRFEIRGTLSQLEESMGVSINRNNLSDRGEQIFYGEGVNSLAPDIPEVRGVHI